MNVSYEEAVQRGWLTPADVPKAAKRPRGKNREAEGEEQAELIRQFRARYPAIGDLLIHIPNGGSRKNAFEGWRMKQQGVRAGVSDLFLPVARGRYFGLWLEFKAAPPNNAVVSNSQQVWVDLMREQSYQAEICLGVAAALEVLDAYLRQPVPAAVSPDKPSRTNPSAREELG